MSERTFPASPYKGLAPYSEKDSLFFFGRENERRNIISNLMASRLTLLYGSSGVGKSSVLSAGVVHDLRRLARKNTDESGSPEFAVAVFNNWRSDDPIAHLAASVRKSVVQVLDEQALEQLSPSLSLVETFRAWAELVGGKLLVILDQFEDYFLYHGQENSESRFASEFSNLVNCRDLKVNFLISIRADAYTDLDLFEDNIPNCLENCLRIPRLDRSETEAAIRKPVEQYNRFYGAGQKRIDIEDALVEAVLKGPSTVRPIQDNATSNEVGAQGEALIGTPFLQLVMTCLWKEEMRLGSTRLRLETLENLGGVDKIVKTHLTQAMKKLSGRERSMAVPVFHYLVTPSGHRMAYAVSDLARQANLDQQELAVLLEKLADGENRILHPIAPEGRQDEWSYEVSLDVLAKPILEWRTRKEEKIKAVRRVRLLAIALFVMSILALVAFVNFRTELARRRAVEDRRRAMAAVNKNSQVFTRFYNVLLDNPDPKQRAEKFQEVLPALESVLSSFEEVADPQGNGMVLNNIAGYHRYIGESYSAVSEGSQAKDHYQEAHKYYEQALDELAKTGLGMNQPDGATTYTGQAVTYMDEGKYAEAEQLYNRSLEILENSLGPDDRSVADAVVNLAECYSVQGRYADAERLYKRAMDIRKNTLSSDDPDFADSLYVSAWLYLKRGKYAEAEPLFRQTLAILEHYPDDIRSLGNCLDGLSALYREWGKYDEAEKFRNEARRAYKGIVDQDHLLAAYHFENAALLHDRQDKGDAEQLYKFALGILELGLGNEHPDTARCRSELASFYYRHNNSDEAEKLFNQAYAVQKVLQESPDLAQTLFGLAQLFSYRGKFDDAGTLFIQALKIQTTAIPDHRSTADTTAAYADLLRKTNRDGEASQMEERAARIRARAEK